jgi:hypothetical protein
MKGKTIKILSARRSIKRLVFSQLIVETKKINYANKRQSILCNLWHNLCLIRFQPKDPNRKVESFDWVGWHNSN